jgi:hypothetical protein
MKSPAIPTQRAKAKTTAIERHERAQQILTRMLDGRALREIADAENLTVRRAQQIAAEEIERRNADPYEDYKLLQIARLECALEMLGRQIDEGKASVVPAFVKVIEQLTSLTRLQFRAAYPKIGYEPEDLNETFERLNVAREIAAERRGAKPTEPQPIENKQNGEIGDFTQQ